MRKHEPFGLLCAAMMIFAAGAAWAADRPAPAEDTPAILAALDSDNIAVLDDQEAMAIRGQDGDYKYVLVKILGINALDFGPGITWTWNPLGFRYGAYGGPGWSNASSAPADAMDALFKAHDEAYNNDTFSDQLEADKELLAGLQELANTDKPYWGKIYYPSPRPTGLSIENVYVSGVSFFGNKLFFGWRAMPYTEYARRQAMAGMGALIFGKSLVSAIRLQ